MKEFLNKLGITDDFSSYSNDSGKIIYKTLNDFFRIYTILDLSDLVEEDTSESNILEDKMHVKFDSDTFTIELFGDLDEDKYTLEINRNGD